MREDELNISEDTVAQLGMSRAEFVDLIKELEEGYDEKIETKEDVLEEMHRILSTSYQKAKQIHINTEEKTGETNLVAITNFRDGLDHVSKISDSIRGDDVDIDRAIGNLAEMRAHIERTIFDGAQEVPEKYTDEVIQNRTYDILYTITGLQAPSNREWEQAKDNIAREIASGRNHKATDWEESLKHFKNAEKMAESMKNRTPPKREVQYRLVILGIGIGGAFLTLMALILTVIGLLFL